MPSKAVSIQEMLLAREARHQRQQGFLRQYGLPLISYTLNIAGPVKATALLRRGFRLGQSFIRAQLQGHGMEIVAEEVHWAHTGDHWLAAVRGNGMIIKQLMVAIEEDGPFGRVLDLDVLEPSGEKIQREQIKAAPRTCLLCGEPAMVCARSRAHPPEALFQEAMERVEERLNWELAEDVAAQASRALLYELATTPKPGLVDRDNSGAHQDMDYFTFLDSASHLTAYFRDCVLLGLEKPKDRLLGSLRYRGQRAEARMLAATKGINTHKGAIFSLGLLCGAVGLCGNQGKGWTAETLCEAAGALAAPLLEELSSAVSTSAGLALYHSAGITGARGEAAAGFPRVLGQGLPALEAALAKGWALEQAGVKALLALMSIVEDTNLLKRGGFARHGLLLQEAKHHLEQASPPFDTLRAWDRVLSAEGLSPGGCADLLAVTFFLHFLGNGSHFLH